MKVLSVICIWIINELEAKSQGAKGCRQDDSTAKMATTLSEPATRMSTEISPPPQIGATVYKIIVFVSCVVKVLQDRFAGVPGSQVLSTRWQRRHNGRHLLRACEKNRIEDEDAIYVGVHSSG